MKKKDNYTHKKTNEDYIKNKNKLLIDSFVKKTTKTEEDKENVGLIKTEKVVDFKKDSKVKELEEENSKLKNQLKIEKEKRQILSEKLSKSDKKCSRLVERLEKSEKDIEILMQDNSKILKEKSYYEDELSQLKSNYTQIDENIKADKKKIQSLSDKVKAYEERISELSQKDIIKEKDLEIQKLNIEKEELLGNIEKFKKHMKIYKFEKELNNDKLNIQKRIADISKIELEEKIKEEKRSFLMDRIKAINYYFKAKYKKVKTFIDSFNKFIIVNRRVHGTLEKKFFKYRFIDTNGKKYKVDIQTIVNKPNFDGVTCIANITDKNIARIIKTYPTINEATAREELSLPKKQKVVSDKKDKKEKEKYAVELNILIITSMSATNYKNRFKGLGLNVDIFDSYDENAKRLDSILSKYDIVFYCIRHSRHYCGNVIKNQSDYEKDSIKYNFLDNDSVTNMLSIIDTYMGDISKENERQLREISLDSDACKIKKDVNKKCIYN